MTLFRSAAFALPVVFGLMLSFGVQGASLTVLHAFHSKGQNPIGGVIAVGSRLIGTTSIGGPLGGGTVYRIHRSGAGGETSLHNFGGIDDNGNEPRDALLRVGQILYGTTFGGTLFEINVDGTGYAVLHLFGAGDDGTRPQSSVIYADGFLYGTTLTGGVADFGTVFKYEIATGTETVLHGFANGSDGSAPIGGLIKVGSFLFGTTNQGGSATRGTIFKVKIDGTHYTLLHTFLNNGDGVFPQSTLVSFQGYLVGTTQGSGGGTVFRIDPSGANFSTVYTFTGGNDGLAPNTALVPDGSGAHYGNTCQGGPSNQGTIFKIDSNWAETTLYAFTGNDGLCPLGNMIDVNGILYGTNAYGGAHGKGTVFRFTP